MLEALVRKNRSCRRFHEDRPVDPETLKGLVNLARLSASGANRQPLKYLISHQEKTNSAIFGCLSWAAYLKDWKGPAAGERPAAYIIVLGDTRISRQYFCDHGIAAQSILLGAREKGLAGCMLAAIAQKRLRAELEIENHLDILLAIALGAPREHIVIETVTDNGDIRYWRDETGTHHVPKRRLEDIVMVLP